MRHRFLLPIFRTLYPSLLRKSDRGRSHDNDAVPNEYGYTDVREGVDGVELLEAYERGDLIFDKGD
jgi:hypothetical protein